MNTKRRGVKWIGQLHLLMVALVAGLGLSAVAQGTFFFPTLPFSNDFDDQVTLGSPAPTDPIIAHGSLSNATFQAGEPYIDGVSSGQTVWGTWVAPSNGIVTLGVEAETFSPLLGVYAGPVQPFGAFPPQAPGLFTSLSLVASNNYLVCYEDGVCGCHWRERNSISFHVVRGQDYSICVDSAIITDAYMDQTIHPLPPILLLPPTPSTPRPVRSLGTPVFTTNVPPGGDFILDLHFTPAPANDNFANRIKLSGTRISTFASNAGATKESGETNHLGNPGGSSVWYSWTAPASGRVTISTNQVPQYAPPTSTGGGGSGVITIGVGDPQPPTCGAEIDQNPPPVFYPVFAAYTGTSVASLTPANTLPMQLAAFPNAVEFDVVKGQTYQLAFDGNQGTTGQIPLCLALTTPPPNADSQHAIKLHGVSVYATGYNAGISGSPAKLISPGVPLPPPPPIKFPLDRQALPLVSSYIPKAAWWSWTAPVSGPVTIDLTGSDYSFPIGVFPMASPGVVEVAHAGFGNVSFEAVQGRTYQIAVYDYQGLTGEIKLSLQAPIIDLPASNVLRLGRTAILTYKSAPKEIVALLYSTDNQNWQIVQTTPASGKSVLFVVKQPPTPSGPYYRAIIFDRTN